MSTRQRRQGKNAFTRLELAAVMVVVGLLVLVGVPVVSGNGVMAVGVTCQDNLHRLTRAWQMYAEDNGGEMVNNFGIADMNGTVAAQSYLNWTHNIMDWSTAPSNTNRTYEAASKLYPYLENPTRPFKCPADSFRSAVQQAAGWSGGRLRSYSMNGFMGRYAINSSDASYRGENFLGPQFRQFVMSSTIVDPASSMVFLDEHPDSINDGFFINVPGQLQWYDLPGSHHNGAGSFSFADGHAEIHSWLAASTKAPVRFGFVMPPALTGSARTDWEWVVNRMTVTHTTLAVTKDQGTTKVAWTPTTSTFALQSSGSLSAPDWKNVTEPTVRASGQVAVDAATDAGERYFRLMRP
jgi:prepilin-type processing-associated H-X9-DG protein